VELHRIKCPTWKQSLGYSLKRKSRQKANNYWT